MKNRVDKKLTDEQKTGLAQAASFAYGLPQTPFQREVDQELAKIDAARRRKAGGKN